MALYKALRVQVLILTIHDENESEIIKDIQETLIKELGFAEVIVSIQEKFDHMEIDLENAAEA